MTWPILCVAYPSWWLCGKECACQRSRCGFDPWVRKIPLRRKWQPTLVFLPRKSHGQRSLVGCSPWGCKESDTTEQLNIHAQPIPSTSPEISSNKWLTQSVKQRCRMIPWKSHPACEWGVLPHCWCECNIDKVTSCYPTYLSTHCLFTSDHVWRCRFWPILLKPQRLYNFQSSNMYLIHANFTSVIYLYLPPYIYYIERENKLLSASILSQ